MDIVLKPVSPFQLKSPNKPDISTHKDFSHYFRTFSCSQFLGSLFQYENLSLMILVT